MRLGCPGLTDQNRLTQLEFLITHDWNRGLSRNDRDALLRALADLKRSKVYIANLEAEVEVRPNPEMFPLVPEMYRYPGARSAFCCGFDAGWKMNEFKPDLYTRSDYRRAYEWGYRDGAQQAAEKILALKAEVK